MTAYKDKNWADLRRVIDAEKAHALETTDLSVVSRPPRQGRMRLVARPRLAAAFLLLVIGAGLFLLLGPGQRTLTLDQLPFFASTKADAHVTEPSPREREMGRRLAGWISLARRNPAPKAFPAGWLEQGDPGTPTETRAKTFRKTLLHRFLWASNQHQEV